jgi:hypothetical protein
MATPDESKIRVFRKGILQGFNTSIPFGGQIAPISTPRCQRGMKKTPKES